MSVLIDSQLHPAFILHTRPFRDTSLLIDFFCKQHGRISCVARGAKRPKSSWRGILQPFIPLLISCRGRTELLTLTSAEVQSHVLLLKQQNLLSGFYLNELLIRLLQRQDPHSQLFDCYAETLIQLSTATQETIEIALRCFELTLLKELGYGLQLEYTVEQQPVQANLVYQFFHEKGLTVVNELLHEKKNFIFSGESLLDIARQQFSNRQVLKDAKRLLRLAITQLLGNKPLNTRQLYADLAGF